VRNRIVIVLLGCLFCLFLTALFIVVLFFATADIDYESLRFYFYRVVSLIGIVVSTSGLVITGFFVVLAIRAYSHTKEVRGGLDDFQRKIKRFNTLSKSYAHSLDTGLEMTITLAEITPKSEKYRDVMVLEQARLCYRFPMPDKERQKTLLRKLAEVGEFEDIFELQNYITDNPDEDEEIKELAKAVLEILMKKWKKT